MIACHGNILTCIYRYAAKPWNKFINMANQRYISEELFDLLDNLLRYDHQERLTAKEAMNHPFFGMLFSMRTTHKKLTSYHFFLKKTLEPIRNENSEK